MMTMTMKKLATSAMAFALVLGILDLPLVRAQANRIENNIVLSADWDADSTTYTFPRLLGVANLVMGGNKPGTAKIVTAGDVVTITSSPTTAKAFTGIDIGDLIIFNNPGTAPGPTSRVERVVVTNADDDTITVEESVNIPVATTFGWRDFVTGTGAEDGWFPMNPFDEATVVIQIDQMNAASIDYKVECRHEGPTAQPQIVIGPTNKVAADSSEPLSITEPWHQCRVGIDVNTDDGDDTGANAEKITISVFGRRK